ncbi:MAG: C40 family peptidase [Myxococcales bacterium]|nr:C40 family peptidase [Myxococcales bacterium]USN50849.1 MAG: C40 family peptidase [Myxococcales bacterium]
MGTVIKVQDTPTLNSTLLPNQCEVSLTSDFSQRDQLPQTDKPKSSWPKYDITTSGGWEWGPLWKQFPKVSAPAGCDSIRWKRERILAVAKKYVGIKYRHHHILAWSPEATPGKALTGGVGLDCSNFTTWVYNYGLGILFTSDVAQQSVSLKAGRKLRSGENFEPGDLLYIGDSNKSRVVHVVIYVDPDHIIDSTSSSTNSGVQVRKFDGWYKSRFMHARRVIE